MELLDWVGARRSDACRLGSSNVARDGVLVFRQGKTTFEAYTPWHCSLPDYVMREAPEMAADRVIMRQALACLAGRPTFLCTFSGKQRSSNGWGT